MLEFTARTHRGCKREKNEDRFFVPPENGPFLFAVADGMGGHAAGEVASTIAIDLLEDKYYKQLDILQQGDPQVCRTFLEEMVLEIHETILAAQQINSTFEGMGTTLTVMLRVGEEFLVGHVGDSQLHFLREEECLQITEDHSVVAELIRNGEIGLDEAKNHPQRNMLTSALGAVLTYKIDFYCARPQRGDCILLCTDGLTAMIKPKEVLKIVNRFGDLEAAADGLLRQANASGGLDNITFILIRM